MATANVKGFVNNIESMCECNICYVAYDEIKHIPRLLPCHHTFCSECLSKHCKGQKLKCPYCMKEHNVRNRDINIFPKDNTRRDLKELLEKFSQSLCGVCRRHDNVKYFCGTCRIRMCRGCYKERKQNVCIMHDIDIPEDSSMTPDTSLESPEIHSKDVCLLPGHENNQLKYFCSEIACSKPACSNCVVELHNGHDYKPIKNEYENRMQSMKNSCMATHAKIVKANELLKIVENQHFSMTENFRKGRDKLSLEANKGIRYINDFEENASKNTNEIIQENLTVLDRKKEQLKFFIENATECCAISEEALTGNNFITFLSVEKTLREKLILFEKSEVDKPLDPMTEGDFELENPIMELRKRIERMTRNGDENTGGDNSFQECWYLFSQPMACVNLFLLLFGLTFALLWFHVWFFRISYTHVFKVDESYLGFYKSRTTLNCHTKDGRIISNAPMVNMPQICGNEDNQYIFKGAFTNTTFVYGAGESFMFEVEISKIRTDFPGLILFEFGISKSSVDRRNLLGPPSEDLFGWFLKISSTDRKFLLINTEGDTVYTGFLSATSKFSFYFSIDFNSNRTISLKVKSKKEKIYNILDETRSINGKFKRGFVKICDAKDAYVNVQIINDNMTFNKSTLFPQLYIAPDNRSISNTHLTSFTLNQYEISRSFQDILLLNCTNKCIYVIKFRVVSPKARTFSLVLTNNKFLPSAYHNITLFSYDPCYVTNYITYESFCVSVDPNVQSDRHIVIMKSDVWHLMTIIVHKKYNSASFLLGNTEFEIQDGYIFESDIPVLRWVVHDMNANVEVRLGDRNEFQLLTWFDYRFSKLISYILSFFKSNSVSIVLCTIVLIFHGNIFDLICDLRNILQNTLFNNQGRLDENGPRLGIFERRRRGRRQRNR